MTKGELEKELKKAKKKILSLEERLKEYGATFYGFEPTTATHDNSIWKLKGT